MQPNPKPTTPDLVCACCESTFLARCESRGEWIGLDPGEPAVWHCVSCARTFERMNVADDAEYAEEEHRRNCPVCSEAAGDDAPAKPGPKRVAPPLDVDSGTRALAASLNNKKKEN